MSSKVAKTQAGYIPPPAESLWPAEGRGIRCGTCVYSDRQGGCALVEGRISSQGCCNLWSADGKGRPFAFASGTDIEDLLKSNKVPARARRVEDKPASACVIL